MTDDDFGELVLLEATCKVCGCTDSMACLEGCSWVEVDYEAGVGICSNCAAQEETSHA